LIVYDFRHLLEDKDVHARSHDGFEVIASIAAALAASVSYGVSDFFGAIAATRLRVIPTTTLSYAAATVTLTATTLVTAGRWSAEVLQERCFRRLASPLFEGELAPRSRYPSLTSRRHLA
jgi:hypothetical protein